MQIRLHPGGMTENSPALQGWVHAPEDAVSPEGTAEKWPCVNRPFGTRPLSNCKPKAEALGYYRISLREKDSTWLLSLQILVALPIEPHYKFVRIAAN